MDLSRPTQTVVENLRQSKAASDKSSDKDLLEEKPPEYSCNMYDFEHPEKMSKFIRGILLSQISETMDQLQILKDINQVTKEDYPKEDFLKFQTIEERYMGAENHEDYRIDCVNNNFDKLARDIDVILRIFALSCREIYYRGTFENLKKSIKTLNMMHDEEVKLLEDERKGEQIIKDLKAQCEQERLDNNKTIEQTNEEIQKLRFEVEDIIIYGQHEVEFYTKWENARNEQNDMKCKEKENYFQNIIDTMKTNVDRDSKCHVELMTYLTETRNDFLDEIQYWLKRYDEDLEAKEADLIRLRADLEKLMEDREKLQEEYERRTVEMEDFLEYKRIQLEKKVTEMRENHAAKVIQRWWIKVMIRKKLGPYSKKKKKGKGKDAKGKGKGKKKK